MGEDLPARRIASRRHPLGVDGDDDALGAKLFRSLAHNVPVGDRR